MTIGSLRLALLAGLALPLGLASASFAQDAPPAPPAAAGIHRDHMRDPAERRAHMAEHISTVLQLQPSQQAALAAYLDALKPPGDLKDHMQRPDADEAHLPAPERMDHMLAHIDAMRVHLVAATEATKLFYAQLSPSQQRAFDDLAPMMLHHMGGHGGMGHGDHHRDGEGPDHPMGPAGQPPG